jgi:hypothetical protein
VAAKDNVEPRAAGPGATDGTSVTGLPHYPGTESDTGAQPGRGSAAGAPRWITVFGIAMAILVVVTLIILHLSGAIGPGVHR